MNGTLPIAKNPRSIDAAEASERITTLIQHYKHPITGETFTDDSLVHDFMGGDHVWEVFSTYFRSNPSTPRERRKDLITFEESITELVGDYEHAEIYRTFEDDEWLVKNFMLSEGVWNVFQDFFAGTEVA